MSGPKVVRIVTREEAIATCERDLQRLDKALARWENQASRLAQLSDAERAAAHARRASLHALLEQERWLDVQLQVKIESEFLKRDLAEREERAIRQAAETRQQHRRLQENASALLQALDAKPDAASAALRQTLQALADGALRDDAEALLAQGFAALASAPAEERLSEAQHELAQRLKTDETPITLEQWRARQQQDAPREQRLARIDRHIAELQLLQGEASAQAFLERLARAEAEQRPERRNLLLDSLDIRQYLTEDFDDSQDRASEETADADADADADEGSVDDHATEAPPEEAAGEEEEPADSVPDYSALTRLYLENERSPAYIGFDPDYHLYDPQNHAYAWANSGDATHLLQMQHGKGLVTVLTDAWIWQNRNIEQYDNAWLLWYLTQDNQVTLLYRAERDSLATLLARHFPEALAAALLLLLAGLWRAGLRQGPLQPVASRSRRQLEEHLRAGADFLLRQRGHVALLHGLQRDILRRARRRHPGFEQLGVAEQWQILGRMTRLPPSAISQAMRPYPAQRLSAADFTRQVAHLQSLRNAL